MSTTITFVKKILANGEPCAKCADVQQKLNDNKQMRFIDRTIIADERDDTSEGMILAKKLEVDRAPFFIVEEEEQTQVYTVYLKFVKEVLNPRQAQNTQDPDIDLGIDKETLQNSSDLDFL